MALEQRNTTRWTARVGTWIKAAVWSTAEVLSSFLDFREGDRLQEKSIKTVDLAARRIVYFAVDYGITVLSISIGVTMKALDFSLLSMFGVLWIFDFVVAGLFVVIYETTGKDLALGVDFRRAVDTMDKKSRILGFLTTLGIAFLAIVWTGPEKVITFFGDMDQFARLFRRQFECSLIRFKFTNGFIH